MVRLVIGKRTKGTDAGTRGTGRRGSVDAIFSAARSEFGRNGLRGARIENIAKECGRTKQLIYHYFESKEQLFSEVVWDCMKQSMVNMDAEDYSVLDPKEALSRFLFNISEQYRLFPDWVSIMLDENIHRGLHMAERSAVRAITKPVLRKFEDILRRGVESGIFRSDIDIERLFAAALSILNTCFLSGGVFSTFLSLDLKSERGVKDWQEFSIELLIRTIEVR